MGSWVKGGGLELQLLQLAPKKWEKMGENQTHIEVSRMGKILCCGSDLSCLQKPKCGS
jgi:hypothetical protein